MEQSYSHKSQFGDLKRAVDKARKHRAPGSIAARTALLGAGILTAAGGLAAVAADYVNEQRELAPPEEYVAGRVVVKFGRELDITLQADGNVVTGIAEVDALNEEISGESYEQLVPPSDEHDMDNYYIIDVPLDIELDGLVRDFSRISEVEFVQYDAIFHAPEIYSPEMGEQRTTSIEQTLPNDKYVSTRGSWGQDFEDQWPVHRLNAVEAWQIARGTEIDIWVLDTGIDPEHPDLEGRMSDRADELGYNFVDMNKDTMDRYGHGTLTSGGIGATTDNGIGIAGITWAGKFIPIKVYSDEGVGTTSSFTRGIAYSAANGARLMNMSMTAHVGPHTRPIDDAMKYAYSRGAVMLVSAGNENWDARKNSPANSPYGITVGAVDHEGRRADFPGWWGSNYGPAVDVAAPGVGTLTLISRQHKHGDRIPIVDGQYVVAGGTSMAAPYVTGEVALMFAANPGLIGYPDAVKEIVKAAVTPYQSDKYIGTGIINYEMAVRLAQEYEVEDADTVPPHLDRIAYLLENIPEGESRRMRYSPYFQVSEMFHLTDNMLAPGAERGTLLSTRLFATIDVDASDDGTIDVAVAAIKDRKGFRGCAVLREEMGEELRRALDLYYLLSTDAWYRAFTEGNGKMQGNVGKKEFGLITGICDRDGRWKPLDPDSGMLEIMRLMDE